MKNYQLETKCLHAGYKPGNGEPRAIPIVQSTTFRYESSEQMARLFDLSESGYFYTRLANPTNDAVAARIAELEGGVAGMLTSSGQAASLFCILNLCSAGDHVVSSSAIYGGTFNLFDVTLRRLGISTTFVSPDATDEEIQAAFTQNTKLVFGETIANPALSVFDIERFANVAHKNGVPLIVDNTFATPVLCRPFEFGADIVMHSTTKYMDGHASGVGGVIVDSGNFDWSKYPERYPDFNKPDDSYHGVIYAKDFGKAAFITKATAQLMRDLGSIQSPQNAFILGLGLESLPLRMARHCENALAMAKHLENHPMVTWVNYPGLESNKYYDLTQKYLPNGASGVISFGIKGGRNAAIKFMDSLELASIATHVADAKTCVLHPAGTTHRQLDDAALEAAGVGADLIRLSVGLENIDDLIADVDNALKAAE